MTADTTPKPLQIDIVSDVMCPWCIVGYKQLEQALAMTGHAALVRWHPFELNPAMPAEGQELGEHLAQKYGTTPEQSAQNRDYLTGLGASLGITFNFGPGKRILNTYLAHQLLDWARGFNLQHPLKLALFEAYFTRSLDVSDPDVLADVAAGVGLDRAAALEVLASGRHAQDTRDQLNAWAERGISGVPSIVVDRRYLVTGAQGAENYAKLLQKATEDRDAAA